MVKQEITFDLLNKTVYGELKVKLETLGVGHVWKGGLSKKELINRALEALDQIKNKDIKDMSTEEVKRAVDKLETKSEISTTDKPDSVTDAVKVLLKQPVEETVVKETVVEIEEAIKNGGEGKSAQNPVFGKKEKEYPDRNPNANEKAPLKTNDLEAISETPVEKSIVETPVEETAISETTDQEAPRKSEITKPKYSEEVIRRNLITIEGNLKNNVPGQRNALLKEKARLLEMLEYYAK